MQISDRAAQIEPFYVMEMAKKAQALAARSEALGRPMIYLNIGEPDAGAAPGVQQAATAAIAAGHTQYTAAAGLPPLRQALSDWYQSHFALDIAPERIVITAGASAALQLACLALLNPGDEVLMPDPCYPCNRHFVTAAGGHAQLLPSGPEQRFQLSARQVSAHWGARTRGVLLASPSNPTGTSIEASELEAIHAVVQSQGGLMLVDEIYLGLNHSTERAPSALRLGAHVLSINSFSKYFGMTGWRLGWLVVPPELVPVIERLAQNLYICASAIAQHAALACFAPESLLLYEARRQELRARRDFFIPALEGLGLHVPVMPDGAFYAWADTCAWCQALGLPGSWALAEYWIEHAGVVATPGRDFGLHDNDRYIRFSTASSTETLRAAIERLAALQVRVGASPHSSFASSS